jgi:hypothetical protein
VCARRGLFPQGRPPVLRVLLAGHTLCVPQS